MRAAQVCFGGLSMTPTGTRRYAKSDSNKDEVTRSAIR